MENRNLVLVTLAQMAAESAQPTLYQFVPRELILRLPIDWSAIYSALTILEEEGAVQIFHADTVKFSITQFGIDTARELQKRESQHNQEII